MVALVAALLGCGAPGVAVAEQVVPAACGLCVFHAAGATSCHWAVELDGAVVPVGGAAPPFDMAEAHGPEGACKVERKARVAGTLTPDGRFVATTFELLPYDGTGRRGTDEH